jgi:NAD-dependent deacetylase
MTNPAVPIPTDAQRRVAGLLRRASSTVVLTGAGISVPSGIPDFRTPVTGLWADVDPMQIAHIDVWRSDPARFWAFYAQRFHLLGPAEPNDAHRAIGALQRRGLVGTVITQNIDRLHAKAGTQDVVEMHGSIARGVCLACGAEVGYEALTGRIDGAADGVPRCHCGQPMKPGVILFGEMLASTAIERAVAACEEADLIVAVGSSLEVHPVGGLPSLVLEQGGTLVLVTQGMTPYDELATERLGGDVVDELQGLLAALDESA